MGKEKLIEIVFKSLCNHIHKSCKLAENIADDLIANDVVPVVRCKDCMWYRIAPIDNVPYCCHESGYCGEHMKGLFFCACGERKDT